jgi:8-oxo-dGTP pyrophosphatase MutT (NUDIX family)
MPPSITLNHLQTALALPDFDVTAARRVMNILPAERPPRPPAGVNARQAGVLVLVYPVGQALTTLLIQRTPDPGVHSGQIGFPGGSWEVDDADLQQTALREACEEVGVCGATVRVRGQLTSLYIPPSQFMVHPTVGTAAARPAFTPSPAEVAGLLELPLVDLLDPARKQTTTMTFSGLPVQVPYYDVEGHVVWGATALLLAELEGRLRVAIGGS